MARQIKFNYIDEDFIPIPDGCNGYTLKYCPKDSVPAINPRSFGVINCGVSVDLPVNLRVNTSLMMPFASKGIVLLPYADPVKGDITPIKLYVFNAGKQIVPFKAGDHVAKMWFSQAINVALVRDNE